jgi:preprotein translocase subunit SecB
MADSKNGKGASSAPAAAADEERAAPMGAQVVGQFIRDLSFESPNVHRLIEGISESPNLKLEVNVNAERLKQPQLYESNIHFKSHAESKEGTIYILECVYGGIFRLQNVPDQALEPFLLINCPTILFPFLRRLVADITREGGFPPLLLDPIDFASLYMRRQQELAQQQAKS